MSTPHLKAMTTLKLEKFPPSKDELKSAYRRMANQTHPDVGGSSEAFKLVQAAFDELSEFAVDGQSSRASFTVQGDDIFTLGKGLGQLVNSISCQKCSGKGYESELRYVQDKSSKIPCIICRISPTLRKVNCNRCQNGKFTLKSGRIVDCLNCSGSGFVAFTTTRYGCFFCGGQGFTYPLTERMMALTCYECKGAGALEIFNPVLKLGTLANTKSLEDKAIAREKARAFKNNKRS